MITRVEVDGFKSLQRFALDLEPFSALIGPNGAGKSNLLDALSLLSRIAAGDLATAFHEGRGRIREQLSTADAGPAERGPGPIGQVELAVEMLLVDPSAGADLPDPLATRLRYELTIQLLVLPSGVERFAVRREALVPIKAGADPWIDRHPELVPLVRYGEVPWLLSYGDSPSELAVSDPSMPQSFHRGPSVIQAPVETAFLARPGLWARSPHLHAAAEELQRIRVMHLEPRLLREPSERAAPAMTAEGAHLATALAALPREAQARVRAVLVGLLPGFWTADVVAGDHTFHIEVELTDGRRFSSRVLSDGTLRVLGLATLLEASPPGALLAIEEPENGIHPSRVRALLDLLRDATFSSPAAGVTLPAPRQLLITSHSPVVLSSLMDGPGDVVLLDMVRQGEGPQRTRARRIAARGDADGAQRAASFVEVEPLVDAAPTQEGEGEP
jgi:predicted ATPase